MGSSKVFIPYHILKEGAKGIDKEKSINEIQLLSHYGSSQTWMLLCFMEKKSIFLFIDIGWLYGSSYSRIEKFTDAIV